MGKCCGATSSGGSPARLREAKGKKMKRRDMMVLIAGAAAWPMVVRAQQRHPVPKVGVLWHAADADGEWPYYGCLLDGLEELGYSQGKIELIHRFPDEKPEKFQSMAAELVALAPDVLVGVGGAAPYIKKATSNIPMVFMYVADPIGAKLVESIRRPGGNATGLTNFGLELVGKRLEYLKEINPQLAKAAMIVNPTNPISNFYIEQSNAAATKLGLTCKPYNVGTLDDLEPAFDAMIGDRMEAVFFNAESLFYVGKKRIAELALARKLPCCGYVKEVLDAGVLISYGADQRLIARRTAYYVDRILKGERPADMPVEQPTRFQFCINLTTAKALGLTIPPTLLATADEVIE
jgi:putative tryptophan/tyrosine transport system substrate-binding protein